MKYYLQCSGSHYKAGVYWRSPDYADKAFWWAATKEERGIWTTEDVEKRFGRDFKQKWEVENGSIKFIPVPKKIKTYVPTKRRIKI